MKKLLKNLFQIAVVALCLLFVVMYAVNYYVIDVAKPRVHDLKSIQDTEETFDCILILGCGVRNDGTPSPMLEDRIKEGVKLYNAGVAPKLLMSGDHGRAEYDEVNVMKDFAVNLGIPSENIFMDHAGFSTYESIYRAKEIFKVEKLVIVTQKFHIYRALYIANAFNLAAAGVNSDPRSYYGIQYVELREKLARNKDFLTCIIKPKPTYLGETIPVSGNGDLTNDE